MLDEDQKIDYKECLNAKEQGIEMECNGCNCSVCAAQENHFSLGNFLKMQKQLGDTLIESQHKRKPENPIGGKDPSGITS